MSRASHADTREPARIVIADDHALVRSGLKSILSGEPDLEVVGEAKDGKEAVLLCRKAQPDLVLMDVRMPKMDGLAATRIIRQECPDTSVMMVTLHEHEDYLLEALKAGAAGYVLKDADHEELISAVKKVLGDDFPLDHALTNRLLRRLVEETQRADAPAPEVVEELSEPLTPRELQVLSLVAQGNTNRQIAEELFVSPGTVKLHVKRVLAKLGVSDRTQAAVKAIELGLISPPE